MLEKNRDNIAQALKGLAKYQVTQGESVSNGFYYNAFVGNLIPSQTLQPFLDYAFGFRRGVNAGQPPDNAGPRAEFPWPHNGIPGGSQMTAAIRRAESPAADRPRRGPGRGYRGGHGRDNS